MSQAQVFLLTGPETYLIHEQVQAWRKSCIQKYGDMNITNLDAKEVPLKEIISECQTMPFLSPKRLIFIDNLPPSATAGKGDKKKKNYDFLLELLDSPPETAMLVFINSNPDKRTTVYKKLQKVGTVKEFKYLTGPKLADWVQAYIKTKGGKILPAAVNYLLRLTGNNLWYLSQELQKLISYAKDRSISERDIDLLVSPHLETNIFSFTDAISQRRPQQSIDLLEKLIYSGESISQIFYMIVRQFRILIQVKNLRTKGLASAAITKTLKLNPFVVKNALPQVDNFSEDELKNIFRILVEIDKRLKTGVIKQTTSDSREIVHEVEKLVLEICQKN